MKNFLLMCLGGAVTLAIYLAYTAVEFNDKADLNSADDKPSSPKILYWVAPMDANFRRDQPGKSPMGMDLVPVYESEGGQGAGVVTISAAVSNNLGVKTAQTTFNYPTLSFNSSGQVGYSKEQLVHLHARSNGWVEQIHVKDVGEYVEKGQALYGIYSLEFIDAQKDFLRALNSNNDSLMRAAKNRLKALRIDNKVIAQLKRSKKVNQVTTFYAPQSGYIEELNTNEGMYVKPEVRLLTLVDLSQITVDLELEHQYGAWLSQYPGDISWTFTSDLMPTQNWQGKLDYIYPMLSESLRTLRVRLSLDNTKQLLKPNMWLNLKGDITAKEKVLLIPSQALIRTENKTRVVMASISEEEGRFKSVAVTTGRFFNDQVEILSGLQAGDEVVTSAQFLIDSESNIDSDLQRMETSSADHSHMVHSTMDHSNMDHSTMNHNEMDYSDMDHSKMNHAEPKGEHHDH